MDGLDRADVEAARRRRGHEHAWLARELAREHDLLQVAARELAGRRQRPRCLHVVALDHLDGAVANAPEPEEGAGGVGAVRLQRDVRRDAEAGRDAGVEPVLGHVGDAGRDRGAGVARAESIAADAHGARRERPHAGDRLGELALPVARDAGDPERPRRRAPTARPSGGPPRRGRLPPRAPRPRGSPRRSCSHASGRRVDIDVTADHQRGQRLRGRHRRCRRCRSSGRRAAR